MKSFKHLFFTDNKINNIVKFKPLTGLKKLIGLTSIKIIISVITFRKLPFLQFDMLLVEITFHQN